MREGLRYRMGEALSIAKVMAQAEEEWDYMVLADLTTCSALRLFADKVRGLEVPYSLDGAEDFRTALLKELES